MIQRLASTMSKTVCSICGKIHKEDKNAKTGLSKQGMIALEEILNLWKDSIMPNGRYRTDAELSTAEQENRRHH